MSAIFWIISGIILITLYFLYAGVIMKKNKVKEASAGIDVQLKKRYDLIPNLLNMAAKFMAHESKLMEEITKLRTAAMANSFKDNPQEKIKNEKLLESKLKEFNLSVENYPDLKSNQTMMTAMQSMNEVEEHIAAARRFYNAAVNALTNACEIFPSSLIASMLGIRADMPYFEAEEAAKAPVNSGDYFKQCKI